MKNLLENTIKLIGLVGVALIGWFALPIVMIYEQIEQEDHAEAYISTACFTGLACLYVLFPPFPIVFGFIFSIASCVLYIDQVWCN